MDSKKKRTYYIIGSILTILLIIRIFLPSIVLHYANRSLSEMDGYTGRVKDIDISLYRGAYTIDSIYIHKLDSATGEEHPFISAQMVDLSIEWRALMKGKLVGEIEFDHPILLFTKDKAELTDVAKDTTDFRKLLKDFMPLRINRFEIRNGSIRYVDHTSSPKVDIALTDAYVLAENLTNASNEKEKLPSSVQAHAQAYEGELELTMGLNALAQHPTFDLTAELKAANLTLLNDFFIAYGGFDISQGTMSLFTEFAAINGNFKGYVKPIIKDLQVKGVEDQNDSFGQQIKETVIDAAGEILKNQRKEQLATKIPIEGSFSNTTIDTWEAVFEVLRNAFIEALMPSVDHEINLSSAAEVSGERKGFFQRLFSIFKKKDKKENTQPKHVQGLRKLQEDE